MSRKSRHHGRHLPRSKRSRGRRGFYTPPQPSAVAPQPSAVAQPYETARQAEVISSPAAAPRVKTTLAQPINIATELRMIGILSGIILVTLVVLAFVLP